MTSTAVARAAGTLGLVGALVLGAGGLSMAAPVTATTPSGEGTITITETSATSGTATWTYSGLTLGNYVNVDAIFQKGSTPTSETSTGYVKTAGTYVATITVPQGDTWSNFVKVEMNTSASQVAQLPEVPWAAGLPLLLLVPFGVSLWRRRSAHA